MSGEEKPTVLQEQASVETQSPLKRAHELLREAVEIADEFLTQLKVLGETKEERALTLKTFEGLTPLDLRVMASQYRERRALLAYLDKGAPPQEANA